MTNPAGSVTVMALTVGSWAKGCRLRVMASVSRLRTGCTRVSAACVAMASTRARSSFATRSRAVFSATAPRRRVPTSCCHRKIAATAAMAQTTIAKAAPANLNLRLVAVILGCDPRTAAQLELAGDPLMISLVILPAVSAPGYRCAISVLFSSPIGVRLQMLDSQELTGRAATHVQEFSDPPCRLHPHAARALLAMRAAG